MSTNVLARIDAVIGREGRYANDPADRGGETMWGITAATARRNGYVGAMRDLPRATAVAIYLAEFWTRPGFDKLDLVAPELADRLLDIGVNMGPGTGVHFMQRALNVLNSGGADWPDLQVDGGCGLGTLAAVSALVGRRGADGRRVLLGMVIALQLVRYIEIAEGAPVQERFEYGWQLQRALMPAAVAT